MPFSPSSAERSETPRRDPRSTGRRTGSPCGCRPPARASPTTPPRARPRDPCAGRAGGSRSRAARRRDRSSSSSPSRRDCSRRRCPSRRDGSSRRGLRRERASAARSPHSTGGSIRRRTSGPPEAPDVGVGVGPATTTCSAQPQADHGPAPRERLEAANASAAPERILPSSRAASVRASARPIAGPGETPAATGRRRGRVKRNGVPARRMRRETDVSRPRPPRCARPARGRAAAGIVPAVSRSRASVAGRPGRHAGPPHRVNPSLRLTPRASPTLDCSHPREKVAEPRRARFPGGEPRRHGPPGRSRRGDGARSADRDVEAEPSPATRSNARDRAPPRRRRSSRRSRSAEIRSRTPPRSAAVEPGRVAGARRKRSRAA